MGLKCLQEIGVESKGRLAEQGLLQFSLPVINHKSYLKLLAVSFGFDYAE